MDDVGVECCFLNEDGPEIDRVEGCCVMCMLIISMPISSSIGY